MIYRMRCKRAVLLLPLVRARRSAAEFGVRLRARRPADFVLHIIQMFRAAAAAV